MKHLRAVFSGFFLFVGIVSIFKTLLRCSMSTYFHLASLGHRTGDPEGQKVVIPGEAIVIGLMTRVLNP